MENTTKSQDSKKRYASRATPVPHDGAFSITPMRIPEMSAVAGSVISQPR